MSLEVSAREQIIPAGACIGTEAERFMRMDLGEADPADFVAGRLACEGCIQNPICGQNSAEIGTQLYSISGYESSFVAGEQVAAVAVGAVRANVIADPIPFDIRELPADPDLALMFIRRAVRAGQLTPPPHTPRSVHMLTQRFMGEIAGEDPMLYQKLVSPPHMTAQRANRGIQNMTLTLFQQADFVRVAAHKKSESRYNPMRINPEAHFEITRRFAADMIDLDQRGFRKPERQALVYSVGEYQALIDRYLEDTNICPSDFHLILTSNINNPERALRERWARLHVLREAYFGTEVRESRLRERARWRLRSDEELENNPVEHRRLSAKQVETICAAADEGLLEVSEDGRSQTDVVIELHQRFGTDPTFAAPSAISRFTHLSVDEAVAKCEVIQDQVSAVLEERGDDQSIPEAFVRHYVLQSGLEPYATIKNIYETRTIHARLQHRAHLAGIKNHIPQWAIGRIVALYGPEDADIAADALYGTATLQRYVTHSLSEMSLLQDVTYKDEVNQICDPHTGQYMTFSPALRDLTPEDRLAFAYHHGLSRLLYGVDLDHDQVAAVIGVRDVCTYCIDHVLPKCDYLLAQPGSDEGMPTLLRRLSDDLLLLETTTPEATRRGVSEHVTTMIGGLSLTLGPDAIRLKDDTATSEWLRKAIFERCKPNHLDAAADIERAIEQGVLELLSDGSGRTTIAFAEYIREDADEQEIAALAHCLGIDTFMFGYDMKELLEARLEIGIIETAHRLMELIREKNAKPPIEVVEEPHISEVILSMPVPKNSFFTSLDDATAKWLLGNIVESKRRNAHQVSEAAKRVKRELEAGRLQVLDDGDGYMIHIDPAVARTASAQVLERFVDACGIRGALDPASRQLLSRDTAADQRQRTETMMRQFESSVMTIERTFLRSLTPTQLPRIHQGLMAHLGRGDAPESNGTWETQVLSRALQRMGISFRTYRDIQQRALMGRELRASLQLATSVIGDPLVGAAPVPFNQALQTYLFSNGWGAVRATLLREAFYGEIAGFGKWLARQDWIESGEGVVV